MFRGELEDINDRIERIEKDNKGNFLLNQLSISLDGFTNVWEFLVEAFSIYFIKGGKKQMSEWEFLNKTGMQEEFEKMGYALNPVHDVLLLIPHREKNYEKSKDRFIEERKLKKVDTTNLELNFQKYTWLKGELTSIDGWLNPNKGMKRLSTSDQIEVIKYKRHVKIEMDRIEAEINAETTTNKESREFKENIDENDFLRSTIEEFLLPFKESGALVLDNHERLVNALYQYIKTKKFPADIELIKVGRTNKKRLGWAINRILMGEGIGIEYELLNFANQKISIYLDDEFNKTKIRKSNLYKFFTQKIE